MGEGMGGKLVQANEHRNGTKQAKAIHHTDTRRIEDFGEPSCRATDYMTTSTNYLSKSSIVQSPCTM